MNYQFQYTKFQSNANEKILKEKTLTEDPKVCNNFDILDEVKDPIPENFVKVIISI